MILQTDGATVDLVKMGLHGRDRSWPLEVAVLPTDDDKWEVQQRGVSAPVRRLQGTFPGTRDGEAAALIYWNALEANATKVWNLLQRTGDGSLRRIARVYLSGRPRLAENDLINGEPITSRWSLELTELAP